ncbi:hypothetical protein [Galbibacter sp.]|jgi:hypothetical protein|uniref:hypothetical protein n=1 Tax=Galbibacter sp. TaxID=2918471 RepID=UPI003A930177
MKVLKGIGIGIFIVLAIALYVFAVMQLWNWLMPKLFDLSTISFWEAGGIVLLCKLLFSGGGKCKDKGKGKRSARSKVHWKSSLKERLQQKCEHQKTTNYE